MSTDNPIHSNSLTRVLYPIDFEVVCVIGGDDHAEHIIGAKEICEARGIRFRSREFDSGKYEHDAIMITSVPYFYLHKKKSSYPYEAVKPEEIVEKIKMESLRCREEAAAKQQRAKERKEAWSQIFQWFSKKKSVFSKS